MSNAIADRLRKPRLVTDYGRELQLLGTPLKRVGMVVLLFVWIGAPLYLTDFPLSVLNLAGIFVVGTIGLNLLTGYTGQVSLANGFFMAIGAYVWAHFGGDLGYGIWLWLPLAAIVGGIVGGVIGPFALRLRGNYLAIVSLGLVFIGLHLWRNYESVTGGGIGFTGEDRAAYLFGLNFEHLDIGGHTYTVDQSYFWLVWAIVALVALLAKNIVRSRPGRAMQAIRDRDVAAAVIGVSPARYKIGAFVVSSGLAAMSGALYGSYLNFVSPDYWNLFLSIQFIAMLIVGGVATIFGSILGGLFVGSVPSLISNYGDSIPLIERLGISVPEFNALLFGVVIVVFLVFEPHGLAGIWFRIKAYFRTWPFSY